VFNPPRRNLSLSLLLLVAACLPCRFAVAGPEADWESLVSRTRSTGLSETLLKVNRTVNSFKAVTDLENWHRSDYWATPWELLQRGAGDCEDFAIAKYFLLLAHGFPPGELRLMLAGTYNSSRGKIETHLVLLHLAAGAAEPVVLDNLNDTVLGLSERPDLLPRAGFDADNFWNYRNGEWRQSPQAGGIAAWRHLMERWNRQLASHQVAAVEQAR
jgi:predicted transglutaminase-like cysteine proteinase